MNPIAISLFVTMMLGSISAAVGEASVVIVPERHWPQSHMGRDFWRVLYKYGDFACRAEWASPARLTRFDNPGIYDCPAFQDVVWSYFGRVPAPDPAGGRSVWRTLRENFFDKEPDREILTSNPDPTRPFFLLTTGKRDVSSWGSNIDLDHAEYARFRTTHPNLAFDGRCSEWLNDLMRAYRNIAALKDSALKTDLQTLLGTEPPNTRYEIVRLLKRYFERRKQSFYGGRMCVLDGHLHSFHLAKDIGAEVHSLETTDTCGYGTTPSDKVYARGHYDCDGTSEDVDDNSAYRWNVSAMFARGAARQFRSVWEWYIAGYTNGWTEDGKWWNNTVTVFPESDDAPESYEACGWHCGPDFGQSASNIRRALYLAYLSGCTFENFEEWTAQFTMWDKARRKTVLSPRGKMYVEFADFTRRHADRGAAYAPVAICVPVAQGYPTWGGYPWGLKRCGYTQGDTAVDAVFYTLVPGYERAREHRKGVEYNIPHSPFAQMYDVIAPDVKSQTADELFDVLRSYKAVVVAGNYPDRSFEPTLARYAAQGGRVIRLDEKTVPAEPESRINEIMAGRVEFKAVKRIFEGLQKDYFPLKVDGDVCYGLTRTKTGWWLWAINSKGVTKFVDKPERIDPSKNAELTVSVPAQYGRTVRELTREEPIVLVDGTFKSVVPAGDLRIFEIRE